MKRLHLPFLGSFRRGLFIPFVFSVGGLWAPAVALGTSAAAPEPATGWQPKPEITTQLYMAVTAHPLATDAATAILKDGGNAMDAAIAAQFVLNLVEPQSSGIGGGAFLLYWDSKNQELLTFDGRETAPVAADGDYFRDASGKLLKWQEARASARAVGVPGTLHLLETAHRRLGQKPWASLISPAIDLAEGGFKVSPRLAQSIAGAQPLLRRSPTTRAYFFTSDDAPLPEGYWLTNPAFSKALKQIANGGADVLYRGPIGQAILQTLKDASTLPSLMSVEDLSEYETIIRPPVCARYRENSVCGMGPPSSGALTVGQILGLLDGFNLKAIGPQAEGIHLIAEASRLAYADRARYMADADFVSIPTDGLLDAGYLEQRRALIKTDRSMGKAEAGMPPGASLALAPMSQPEAAGTSHLSIVDKEGNIVSMTTTIESGFGSGLMAEGFLLNNEMTDFSFKSEVDGQFIANRVEGGKRPRSSMAPTIVFDGDGRPVLVAGSPGGSRIICYVAKTLVSILDWQMSPQQAVEQAHFCNRNGATELERGLDSDALRLSLEALGHEVRDREMNSGLHIIRRQPDGSLTAGVDPRREGVAAGE
ncbi:MAG: gamma-glutamyltransferase [Arenicellales bacterium]